jgi:hypothetical protein
MISAASPRVGFQSALFASAADLAHRHRDPVFAIVGCSVTTQYGIKTLIDACASPAHGSTIVWVAFALLAS